MGFRYPKGTVSHIYVTSDGGADLDLVYDMMTQVRDADCVAGITMCCASCADWTLALKDIARCFQQVQFALWLLLCTQVDGHVRFVNAETITRLAIERSAALGRRS